MNGFHVRYDGPCFLIILSSIFSKRNGLPMATTSERDLVRAVLKTKRSQMLLLVLKGSKASLIGSDVEMKIASNSVPKKHIIQMNMT